MTKDNIAVPAERSMAVVGEILQLLERAGASEIERICVLDAAKALLPALSATSDDSESGD
jgi:hypothetical protein